MSAAGCPWSTPRYVDSTGSTNSDVLAWMEQGAATGSCLVAGEQTAGRGRHGRPWVSDPHAGLWSSTVVRGHQNPARLPLIGALAVTDLTQDIGGFTTVIKWPNDVLTIDGRKLAGILVEGHPDGAVMGIGINLDYSGDHLPDPRATSWRVATGSRPDRTQVLAGLLISLHARLIQAEPMLLGDYRQLCSTLGQRVHVSLPGGKEWQGDAVDIDREGHLIVEVEGRRRTVVAGDVIHATIAT